MSEHYNDRSPEDIQREIERTRADMGDTLDSIRQKASPGQLVDEALHYFKNGGAGQFTNNLGETVKQNPVPVSLIGIGIAWLALTGSRGPSTSSTWTTSESHRGGDWAGNAAARTGHVVQGARARAGEVGERLGEMTHNAQERVSGAASQVSEHTRYQVERAKDTLHYLRTEQPLILGILGFALGAALGSALPSTPQEDALMGEVRDKYLHRAKEAGKDYLEQGKRVAAAAGEAAREEARKEQLPGTQQPSHSMAEKPEHTPQEEASRLTTPL